jgi:Fe-S cluster assembly protein SufD
MNETLEKNYSIALDESSTDFILSEEIRAKAKNIISDIDFPTSRTEAWKYTRVAKIKNASFGISSDFPLWRGTEGENLHSLVSKFIIPELTGSLLVFVNGFFTEELSRIEEENGLEVVSLAENNTFSSELGKLVPLENEIFSSLNTVYAQDGVGIRISNKTELKQSIQVLFINSGENTYVGNRNILICEDFCKAHVTISYVSLDSNASFTNGISEIHVGKNANLTIDKIQEEDNSNYNIISEFVNQGKDSTFTINTITLDGAIVRNNLTIDVNGHNCVTNLNGTYILRGKQHVDNHTIVDHKVAHCESHELYKGVIDENATAVFNGKVFVRKDAQKINAFQSNGNVLLSDDATINSKPELEIYADDVKCSHGSTTGQLDDEAIFYLRARGISEKSAKALMVSAFIGDVIEKIENEAVKEYVYGRIGEKFSWVR